jgi:hypothetical protein
MKVVIMGDVERGIDHGSVAAGGRRGGIDGAFANRAGNPGRAGADILAYREDRSFAVARRSGCIIRRSSAASNAPWRKAAMAAHRMLLLDGLVLFSMIF